MRVRMDAVALSAVALAAGGSCAKSDPVDDSSSSLPLAPVVSPSGSPDDGPTDLPTIPRSSPSPTGFGEYIAVPCAGRPGADEIVQLLRRQSIIDASVRPTVTSGPLCAGTWQYTVFNLAGHDPLEVVTERLPTGLVLITAGTNPCTAKVRGTAPSGILTALKCD